MSRGAETRPGERRRRRDDRRKSAEAGIEVGEFILIYITAPPEISHGFHGLSCICRRVMAADVMKTTMMMIMMQRQISPLRSGFHSKPPFCVSWLEVLYV